MSNLLASVNECRPVPFLRPPIGCHSGESQAIPIGCIIGISLCRGERRVLIGVKDNLVSVKLFVKRFFSCCCKMHRGHKFMANLFFTPTGGVCSSHGVSPVITGSSLRCVQRVTPLSNPSGYQKPVPAQSGHFRFSSSLAAWG